jgi:hypothetical protein
MLVIRRRTSISFNLVQALLAGGRDLCVLDTLTGHRVNVDGRDVGLTDGQHDVWHTSSGTETAELRYFNLFGQRRDPMSGCTAVLARFARPH